MMCHPEKHDLAYAARRALAGAAAAGLMGEALIEATVAEVAAIWAHIPVPTIRAAVLACIEGSPAGGRPAKSPSR